MVLFQEFKAKSEMNGSKKKKWISQYLVSVPTELFLQSTKRGDFSMQVSIQLEIQFLLFFNEEDPMKALF